jgi:peptide deformylase
VIREVLRYPDPRLKARAAEATGDVSALVEDLVDTMRSFGRCVGIAAPQIGVDARVCIVDCSEHPKAPDASGLLVLVNPVLGLGAETEVGREGCLSIPDLTGNVRRAVTVTVDGGVTATGFEARAIQHEVDHLDGLLFLDRVISASDVFARKSRA